MRTEDVDEPVVAAATRTPFESKRRVFVLERVDTMNDEVANRLLKTLEEPAAFVHLILLTDALSLVIPTVISRCQPVRFDPLPPERIAPVAHRGGRAPDRAAASARLALGSARAGPLPGLRGGRGAARRRGPDAGRGAGRRRARRRRARAVAGAARARGGAPRGGRGAGGRGAVGAAAVRAQGPRARSAGAALRRDRQARRPPRAYRASRAGPHAGGAGLPRSRVHRRGAPRRRRWTPSGPRRWRPPPARATRVGCVRPPSAARRRACRSRST